jgi:hypothetical protein
LVNKKTFDIKGKERLTKSAIAGIYNNSLLLIRFFVIRMYNAKQTKIPIRAEREKVRRRATQITEIPRPHPEILFLKPENNIGKSPKPKYPAREFG